MINALVCRIYCIFMFCVFLLPPVATCLLKSLNTSVPFMIAVNFNTVCSIAAIFSHGGEGHGFTLLAQKSVVGFCTETAVCP